MNNKVNYTFVGFLVLLGFFFMFAFSYWLLKPSSKEELAVYTIYFDESVLGLNIDAPVKYRGLAVGKVTQLKLDPKNKEQVEVQITIQKDTPIKTNTLAKLTPQGITGLSYINLIKSDQEALELVKEPDQKYPVIQSEPSFMDTIERSLGEVSLNLSETLSQTTKIFDDNNQKQLGLILEKTANILTKVDSTLDAKTMKDFQETMANLKALSGKLDAMSPKIEALAERSVAFEDEISGSIESIKETYLVVREAMDGLHKTLADGQFNFKEISSDFTPTLKSSLTQMEQTLLRMQNFLEQYERSPSDIFYKQEEIFKGPGER